MTNETGPSDLRAILETRWSDREHLDLPEDRSVVCAISFGYADLAHPVNSFRTSRALVGDAVTHIV